MKAPFAEWRGPLPGSNYAPGQMGTVIGVTVHHMDGSFASADASFHNPDRGASAHFGISYDGHVVQWVDTADVAYHACRANWTGWVGIENESDPDRPDGPPTGAQIESMGAIIRWLGVPAVPASSPTSGGVGYHRQFPGACNAAWGQTACPGQGFVDAIPAICVAAGGSTISEDDVIYSTSDNGKVTYYRDAGGFLVSLAPEEAAPYYGKTNIVDLGGPLAAVAFNARTIAAKKKLGV